MALETVELIRNAEAKAAEIAADARAEAKARMARAADDCNKIDREAVKRASDHEAEVMKNASQKAQMLSDEAKAEAKAKCDELKSNAENRRSAAVKAALEIIIP